MLLNHHELLKYSPDPAKKDVTAEYKVESQMEI